MPELPEVETTLRGIEPHIIGQKISHFDVRNRRLRWPIPEQLEKMMVGQRLNGLSRRGKYLLLHCTKGTLILHLGMSGKLRILSHDTPPLKHDHVDIHFANGQILRFTDPRRFGALLYTTEPATEHDLLVDLGPEPLTDDFTAAYLLQKAKSRKAAIKNFIMDSKVVVGVGNIYAAESLHSAGIHPEQSASKVTPEKMRKLVSAIKSVLQHAIKKGGTTLKDFARSDGSPGYFSIELKVYGKAGTVCPTCKKKKLAGIKLGQRSTVYCPSCQKM